MVASLSTTRSQHPDSPSSNSNNRLLKRFSHKTGGSDHNNNNGGGGLLRRNSKSRVAGLVEDDHHHGHHHHHGIWKTLAALAHHHHHHHHHPWALRFKEEGLPHFLHGRSLAGHPVLYVKLAKSRVPEIMKKGCTMEHVERYFSLLLDFLSHVGNASGFVVVVDMKHSKMKHLTSEETCHALKKLEKLCRSPQYPPQMIQRVFMIHAPLWLSSAWPGLKVFVPDTIPMHVVNSGKSHKKLLKYISQDELPAEYGTSIGAAEVDANSTSSASGAARHLGQDEMNIQLDKLLTKVRDDDTSSSLPAIEPNSTSDLSSSSSDENSSKASTSGGGAFASARQLAVSLRFTFQRQDEDDENILVRSEGVEAVAKRVPNKRRFFTRKLRHRRLFTAGSNSSKTADERSSLSNTSLNDDKKPITPSDGHPQDVAAVSSGVDTAGLSSTDTTTRVAQDGNEPKKVDCEVPGILLPLLRWVSPDPCPADKTTVFYSSTVNNDDDNNADLTVEPLVGTVPPPVPKKSRRSGGSSKMPSKRRRALRKCVFRRGNNRVSEPLPQ